jgi:hypothetical protein
MDLPEDGRLDQASQPCGGAARLRTRRRKRAVLRTAGRSRDLPIASRRLVAEAKIAARHKS